MNSLKFSLINKHQQTNYNWFAKNINLIGLLTWRIDKFTLFNRPHNLARPLPIMKLDILDIFLSILELFNAHSEFIGLSFNKRIQQNIYQ